MSTAVEKIQLTFTRSLGELANKLSDLAGFAYLDSGIDPDQSEMEILTALPTKVLYLNDYAGNIDNWMAEIHLSLMQDKAGAKLSYPEEEGPLTGCISIGSIDYDASSRRLLNDAPQKCGSTAGIYHWLIITLFASQRTLLLFHEDCPEEVRQKILARLDSDRSLETPKFTLSKPFRPVISKAQYHDAIDRIQRYILAGDCYQVNFAQRFEALIHGDSWAAYRAVRDKFAAGFSGFLRTHDNRCILSLSPERFLQIKDGEIFTQPIKGTAPRHSDLKEDKLSSNHLLSSAKDRAENVMITDLLRNDLGKFCLPGSISVTELCSLKSYKNVHHLVSSIRGQLRANSSSGDLLIGASPGGSITGAPKKRAVEIIAELESHPRGAYCGSLFIMAGDSWLHSSIAIRTLETRGNRMFCWGGGGITIASNWISEYQETLDKVGPIMSLLEAAGQ